MPTASNSPLRWLVPVLIVVVSLTVAGGLLARELYQPGDADASEPDVTPTQQPTTSLPPEKQPGPSTVELAPDAAAHPEATTVRTLLQTHFDAINAGDYDTWTGTVVSERVAAQPEQEWTTSYRSTKDGSILVHRIQRTSEQRLTVLVGLTSTQDVADAPPDLPVHCIRWHLTYPLVREDGEWRIDTPPPGTTPEHRRC